MTPAVVLITIFAYFIVLFGISYIVGHRADNQGFFVGNRKSPWYVVAFAMIGSMISGVTFISVPGMVAASGFSYLQMVLGFVVGQILIAYVLVPLFYKMNLVSIYEYLENRFGMSSYRTGAWFFFISKMLGAAVRLFLVCVVLQLLVFGPMKLPFLLNVIFISWISLALYLSRWSKVIDLDRYVENRVSHCFCHIVYLLYRYRFAFGLWRFMADDKPIGYVAHVLF